jgi:phosphoglycolate phosphatase
MFDVARQNRKTWPQAVVFDLDGTLIDSAGDIARALNAAMQNRGFPPFEMTKVKEMIGGGIPKLIERAFLSHGLTRVDLMPVVADFMAAYSADPIAATTLYDGALPLLRRLHADGVKIALCTNKEQQISKDILRRLGIHHFFASIVGERDGLPRKPDPEPLLLALRELGVAPGQAVMVGDSGADSGTAKAAGVPIVLVSYGYSHTPVAELAPDAVIDHLDQLDATLAELAAKFAMAHRTHE